MNGVCQIFERLYNSTSIILENNTVYRKKKATLLTENCHTENNKEIVYD